MQPVDKAFLTHGLIAIHARTDGFQLTDIRGPLVVISAPVSQVNADR